MRKLQEKQRLTLRKTALAACHCGRMQRMIKKGCICLLSMSEDLRNNVLLAKLARTLRIFRIGCALRHLSQRRHIRFFCYAILTVCPDTFTCTESTA